jgi:predicted 2-oxoglutarate/Fe(II)-dependent dioxygenase YbiX
MKNIKIYKKEIDLDICKKLINLYESGVFKDDLKENKLEAIIYSSKTTSNIEWDNILKELKDLVAKKIKDYLIPNKLINPQSYVFSHAGISCLEKNKAVPYHYDLEITFIKEKIKVSHFAVLIYLNDDFEGGELVFPLQNITIKPEKGMMVIFPTSYMYPHAVSPVFSGKRYSVRMSYVLDKDF